jgi:glutamine synthetase
MLPSPSGSIPAEAEDFLRAHPEIEAVDIVLSDLNGVGRGKIIRRHELPALYGSGRLFPISVMALDIAGEDVHETGLTWDHGDADLRAWPVPGTLVPLHGTSPPRAQVLLSLFALDGAPFPVDPRHALRRQVERLAERGLTAAGAFELEFFLLSSERDAQGRPLPAPAVVDGRRSMKTEVYSVDHLAGQEPLIADIYDAAASQGLPVETVISEFAPGQYELTLRYRRDAMRAADDLVMLKRLVRAQARRRGLTACFMAKPVEDYAGSGMHFHVSLEDRGGKNVFAETAGERFSPTLLHAIGGLRETLAESMLVWAPHANSWRRFVARAYAPVGPTWGVNNRSVALRVPAGPAAARRIEHRPSGVDANPYLVAAAVLAGVEKGMREEIDPGPETTGNGYEAPPAREMPPDWRSAIERAAASPFLGEALGKEAREPFIAIKRAEYLRVARTVSELDYQLYLHEV